jgi:hypothetical protein
VVEGDVMIDDDPELFFRIGDGLRRMYLESCYDTVEEFMAALECPDYPEPFQLPRYF